MRDGHAIVHARPPADGPHEIAVRRPERHAAPLVVKALHLHEKGLFPGPRPDLERIRAADALDRDAIPARRLKGREVNRRNRGAVEVPRGLHFFRLGGGPGLADLARIDALPRRGIDQVEGQTGREIVSPAATQPDREKRLLARIVGPKAGLVDVDRLGPSAAGIEMQRHVRPVQIDVRHRHAIGLSGFEGRRQLQINPVNDNHAALDELLPVVGLRFPHDARGGRCVGEGRIVVGSDAVIGRIVGLDQQERIAGKTLEADQAALASRRPDEHPLVPAVADQVFVLVHLVARPALVLGERARRELALPDCQGEHVGAGGIHGLHPRRIGRRLAVADPGLDAIFLSLDAGHLGSLLPLGAGPANRIVRRDCPDRLHAHIERAVAAKVADQLPLDDLPQHGATGLAHFVGLRQRGPVGRRQEHGLVGRLRQRKRPIAGAYRSRRPTAGGSCASCCAGRCGPTGPGNRRPVRSGRG